eukprot:403347082
MLFINSYDEGSIFNKKWIEDVAVKRSESFSARIMIVKFQSEDPTQYSSLVNAIFAAQKLKISVDSLIIQYAPPQAIQEPQDGKQQPASQDEESSLLQQAALLTNGTSYKLFSNNLGLNYSPLCLNCFHAVRLHKKNSKYPVLTCLNSKI